MKRITTKEILAESFRELAESHPVDKITIQEIVNNCEYSPATFYRHFKDKYHLIIWDYVHQTNEIMDRVGVDSYEWRDTLIDGIRYFLKNKKYMKNLLKSTGGHDVFGKHLSEANMEHMRNCILKLSGQEKLDADMELLVRIYCLGTVETTCQWMLDEIDCDVDHLAAIYEQALPEALREILCNDRED